tara:strand:+ start:1806 stop:2708 length:903 start_codon:yes stop_codon:yes gene_type:complete
MKQFTLIEQDRYIKLDGTGIFFTVENWPFTDIEHLWAIQWKDNGTEDGDGWVEYDSPIPNTPITLKEIHKYVEHYRSELSRQLDEKKRREEEERKKTVSWEEAMAELELQMDTMQKNHDEYVVGLEKDHDMQMQRVWSTTEMHEKEHKQQMEFLMKDHELQIERIQKVQQEDHNTFFENQDAAEEIAQESQEMFETVPADSQVTLFDGEVDESLFDDSIDDKYFENVVTSPEVTGEVEITEQPTAQGDDFFKNFDLSTLDDEFNLEMMFEDENEPQPVVKEIENLIAEDDTEDAKVSDNN